LPATALEEATTAGALSWLREQGMIVKQTTKDPETFIPVQGFILSDEMRDKIGSNLVKLFAKAARGNGLQGVTIADAFVTSAMAAVLSTGRVKLNEDEMTLCANIILTFLPFEKLEAAGIARKPLRRLASDKALVRKFRNLCDPTIRKNLV
jgi:hypothetical protein